MFYTLSTAPESVLVPPLQIKPGLIRNFINVSNGMCFIEKFPKVSRAKINESIFVSPQISDLFKSNIFESALQIQNFWGNHKARHYKDPIKQLLLMHQAFARTKFTFYTTPSTPFPRN